MIFAYLIAAAIAGAVLGIFVWVALKVTDDEDEYNDDGTKRFPDDGSTGFGGFSG